MRRTAVRKHDRVVPGTKSGVVADRQTVDPSEPFFDPQEPQNRRVGLLCRLRLCRPRPTGKVAHNVLFIAMLDRCPKCGREKWRRV